MAHWTTCDFEMNLLVYEKAQNGYHDRINGKMLKLNDKPDRV